MNSPLYIDEKLRCIINRTLKSMDAYRNRHNVEKDMWADTRVCYSCGKKYKFEDTIVKRLPSGKAKRVCMTCAIVG